VKLVSVTSLALPDIKVVRFARFSDRRGYFAETYRRSDVAGDPAMAFLRSTTFVQMNESWSRPSVIRGLHFQWDPFMGKLVRTCCGRMVDLFLDIRTGSPTYGKIAAYDMPADPSRDYGEWIWVPQGFAHGNFFTEVTQIEYLCTGEHAPDSEACISPLAPDLDWSLCDGDLRSEFLSIATSQSRVMSDKDRDGPSLAQWSEDERSACFVYEDQSPPPLP
jgi:dTDP-4-dehydrorhamnose 3,5-epimerase